MDLDRDRQRTRHGQNPPSFAERAIGGKSITPDKAAQVVFPGIAEARTLSYKRAGREAGWNAGLLFATIRGFHVRKLGRVSVDHLRGPA